MPSSSRRPVSDADAASPVWPRTWRTLESGPLGGVANMALDLALLDLANRDGVAVLRTYRWARPTVSFGRNESVRESWDVTAMQAAGLDVVRRPTGGRALLHADEVTYSVAMPLPRATPWRAAYEAVNERLLAALRSLDVPVELCTAAETPAVPPDGPACFAAPALGELTVHGRKLVGSAVWRTTGAFLQHGAMLVRDSQDRLAGFRTAHQVPEPPAHATDLAHWLVPSSASPHARVTAALHAAWRATTDQVTVLPGADVESAVGEARVAAHARVLADPDWLWRR